MTRLESRLITQLNLGAILNDNQLKLIESQYLDSKEKYPGLSLIIKDNIPVVLGPLDFCAEFNGETINSVFTVEITFPNNFPDSPPIAKEIGGCIPQEFHKFSDESLCLGTPAIINMVFAKDTTIIGFIEKLLIPYLYSFCYKEKHGVMPYGELHGEEGIFESYKDLFKTSSDYVALQLLKILAEDNYRGHLPCPCESGKNVRNCHGPVLLEIKMDTLKERFVLDFLCYYIHLQESGEKIPSTVLGRKIKKTVNKLLKKEN
jgi:hypothetical protein